MFIISDHGIKPLPEFEESYAYNHAAHHQGAPIIAHPDLADGDDVPGLFIAAWPKIKKGLRLVGLPSSVFDIAPTILHLHGIENPRRCAGG